MKIHKMLLPLKFNEYVLSLKLFARVTQGWLNITIISTHWASGKSLHDFTDAVNVWIGRYPVQTPLGARVGLETQARYKATVTFWLN